MKLAITLCLLALPASANCYNWPLDGSPYDGDTFAVTIPGIPDDLSRVSIRVRGVDTPEIKGHCEAEKRAAIDARDFTTQWLQGNEWLACDIGWDRYGRILADIRSGDRTLTGDLVSAGLGRLYGGERRQGWCD